VNESTSLFDAVAARLVAEPNFAHLATVMRDGSPHVAPVWIQREGERLVLVKLDPSVALRNLERDPRLSISVVDRENPYVAVHIRGRAVELDRRSDHTARWLHALARRYTGEPHPLPLPTVAVVTVEPSRVSSRVSSARGEPGS